MSKCNFTITFPGPAETVLNKARTAIESQGGTFNGDIYAGTFSVQFLGDISGAYTISGQSMNIDINNKPMFIPCNQIENFMKNHFAG